MLWYDMIDMIYVFTAIEFPPGGCGSQTCTKIGQWQHKKWNSKQNNKKYKITKYTK